jgi:hypothetical protein
VKVTAFVAAKDERELVFLLLLFLELWWTLRLYCEPLMRGELTLSMFNVHFSKYSILILRKGYSF